MVDINFYILNGLLALCGIGFTLTFAEYITTPTRKKAIIYGIFSVMVLMLFIFLFFANQTKSLIHIAYIVEIIVYFIYSIIAIYEIIHSKNK